MEKQEQDIRNIIMTIPWEKYETIYGNAANGALKVEDLLLRLFSEDKETALQASYDLWNQLCNQTQVVSAALPAYEILLFALRTVDDHLKEEILDILYNMIGGIPQNILLSDWKADLRKKFENDKTFYKNLMSDKNEDISAFAELIVDQL